MLKPAEHEILNANKYKNAKKFAPPPAPGAQLSLEYYFSRSYMVKCQQLLAFQHIWAAKFHAQSSWAWKKFYNLGLWSSYVSTQHIQDLKCTSI